MAKNKEYKMLCPKCKSDVFIRTITDRIYIIDTRETMRDEDIEMENTGRVVKCQGCGEECGSCYNVTYSTEGE